MYTHGCRLGCKGGRARRAPTDVNDVVRLAGIGVVDLHGTGALGATTLRDATEGPVILQRTATRSKVDMRRRTQDIPTLRLSTHSR